MNEKNEMNGMKRLPIFSYDTDKNGNPTGKLGKTYTYRAQHKKGKHNWVAACDDDGAEVFAYCELCGKRREQK